MARPLVGGTRPSRILIRVDLPAPLAPTRPVTPGATETSRPSSAVTSPGYTLVSAVVSMTGPASIGGPSVAGMCVTVPARGRPVIGHQGEVTDGRAGRSPCGLRLQDDAPASQ